jgi:hypothetical protein
MNTQITGPTGLISSETSRRKPISVLVPAVSPHERDNAAVCPAQTTRPTSWRDFVAALSLANLCYFKFWTALAYNRADLFYMKEAPSKSVVSATMVNTLLFAIILWGAVRVVRARPGGVLKIAATGILFSALIVFANSFRETISTTLSLPFLRFRMFTVLGRNTIVAMAIAALLMIGYVIIRHPLRLARSLMPLVLGASVLLPFGMAHGMWILMGRQVVPDGRVFSAPLLAPLPRTRAVWIIFDEWDERLLFIDRPRGIRLPEVDRFRQSALWAQNAYPPAGETALSMPSLLAGRVVTSVRAAGPDDLQVGFARSAHTVRWGTEPNIISTSRQEGLNIAVVGWYLPYCRVFKDSLNSCWWMPLPLQSNSLGTAFPQIALNQARSLLETNLLSPFGQSLATARQARQYETALDKAVQAVSDPSIGLAIIHIPATHVPYFFDAATQRPTRSNSLVAGYSDGLGLADWTLGRIRTAMEQHHLWDGATVLLSSDHWFRQSAAFDGKTDHRVPFLLKMAGQRNAITYEPAFNTVLSADLVRVALTGKLSRGADVSAWIDQRRVGPGN